MLPRTTTLTRRAGLALATGTLLAGCNPGRDLPPLPEVGPETYRLGVGDQLRVIVFGEQNLSAEFRVDDQGLIDLPMLGSITAAGLTSQELRRSIANELKQRGLLRNPSISVEVTAYRPIFILGEVAKPGQYPYQPGMTMLTTVAVAGGFTYRAVQGYASVIRTRKGTASTGKVFPSSFVAPGDVITVFERLF